MRFELFQETLELIKDHNIKFKAGKVDVEAHPNIYSDLTDDEKIKLSEEKELVRVPV